jgi:hypothetical protein
MRRLIFGLGWKAEGNVVSPRIAFSRSSRGTEVDAGANEYGGWKRPVSRRGRLGVGLLLRGLLHLRQRLLQTGEVLVLEGVGLGLGERALGDERAAVELGDEGVGGDPAVEAGLGEGRFVGLVVAVPAVAVHVDHDVAPELLAELEGELGDHADVFGVVAVHVEDRGLDHLGDVGAVAAGARLLRGGGEADLVVDDDVDGAAGVVAGELGVVERLGHDALAGEGGVAVDEDGDDLLARGVAENALAGAGLALDDGVDDLEVRGVRGHAQGHLVAGGGGDVS